MRLNERQLKTISLKVGINGKAAARLTKSLKISIPKKVEVEDDRELPRAEQLELGISIKDGLLFSRLVSDEGIDHMAAVLKQYSNTCPIVVNWVGRGDFSEKKIPSHINRGNLLHATRTAGRLRAELTRKLQGMGRGF